MVAGMRLFVHYPVAVLLRALVQRAMSGRVSIVQVVVLLFVTRSSRVPTRAVQPALLDALVIVHVVTYMMLIVHNKQQANFVLS